MEKLKLLLVDDEKRFLETTSKLLSRKGLEVYTATNGQDALDLIQKQIIHVVILDVKMPGMDGNTVLKRIKDSYPLVEVIMLTGHGTIESAVEGLKSGATDYLVKPADIEELASKAEEAYEKRLKQEEKIRMARARMFMKSPREILKEADKL
ncbi:MAG: response regulator [Proteobacteria bacterium]|nr:response regulator [Pseudomonadota bacterium]